MTFSPGPNHAEKNPFTKNCSSQGHSCVKNCKEYGGLEGQLRRGEMAEIQQQECTRGKPPCFPKILLSYDFLLEDILNVCKYWPWLPPSPKNKQS